MGGTAPFTPQAWESFYVIVGSSAGALTGLQFVVLTLITEAGMIRGTGETLAAFGSPNVVHFCAALLVSAILSAPWGGLGRSAAHRRSVARRRRLGAHRGAATEHSQRAEGVQRRRRATR